MNKKLLVDYCSIIDSIEETKRTIERHRKEIQRIEKRLLDIENGARVKDKVYGGEGGWQSFVIEGVPIPDYERQKILLASKKKCLDREIGQLTDYITQLNKERYEVMEFITRLESPELRRIITLRCIERHKWHEVAKRMGAGYDKDAVRMAFSRFLQKEN